MRPQLIIAGRVPVNPAFDTGMLLEESILKCRSLLLDGSNPVDVVEKALRSTETLVKSRPGDSGIRIGGKSRLEASIMDGRRTLTGTVSIEAHATSIVQLARRALEIGGLTLYGYAAVSAALGDIARRQLERDMSAEQHRHRLPRSHVTGALLQPQ